MECGGGGALRDHPAGERPRRDDRPRAHPIPVAFRALGREVLLRLDAGLPGGPAAGHQPPPIHPATARHPAAALPLERDRRNLPVHAEGTRLLAGGAEDRVGAAPRLGIVGKDLESDVVQGIVLMRYGGSSLETLKGVHERVDLVRKNHALPVGMEIEPYYDRAKLVKLTTGTVLENLLVGMVLVTLVLWVFLRQARPAPVAPVNLPPPLIARLSRVGFTAT